MPLYVRHPDLAVMVRNGTATFVLPGKPLRITIPATYLDETALSGSTVHVDIGIAGVPPLKPTTRVR